MATALRDPRPADWVRWGPRLGVCVCCGESTRRHKYCEACARVVKRIQTIESDYSHAKYTPEERHERFVACGRKRWHGMTAEQRKEFMVRVRAARAKK